MEELKDYINALKITIRETNLKEISDETIFSEACSFLRGKLAGENKRSYSGNQGGSVVLSPKKDNKVSSPKNPSPDSSSNKPTEKQLNYLNGNAIAYDIKTLTKKKAIELIGKHKEEGKNTI